MRNEQINSFELVMFIKRKNMKWLNSKSKIEIKNLKSTTKSKTKTTNDTRQKRKHKKNMSRDLKIRKSLISTHDFFVNFGISNLKHN